MSLADRLIGFALWVSGGAALIALGTAVGRYCVHVYAHYAAAVVHLSGQAL